MRNVHQKTFRKMMVGVFLLALPGLILAQDMAGARDHPELKRYSGSAIVGYELRNFDEIDFQTSTYAGYDPQSRQRRYAEAPLHLEGKLTRYWYEVPGDIRSVEVYRNYVNELTADGFETLYDSSQDAKAKNWPAFLATFTDTGGRDFIKNTRSPMVFVAAAQNTIRTGTFRKGRLTVRLIVVDWPKADRVYKASQGAYVAVDVLETQAMEQKMAVVSASEIEKSLTASGKVAIYGIYFDFGKAELKPESKPSLEQIAGYLQKDAKARLHVVGHTDNVGGFEANMALSRRRAEAVVAALVKSHGIAASRLIANGVASLAPVASNATDEGRAKNRRVELVLQ